MKFMPYSPRDSEAVLCMLQHHVDYTPEFDSEENNRANTEFWQDVMADKDAIDLCYLLKEEKGNVLGILTAKQYTIRCASPCWYISALWVKEDVRSDKIAKYMVESFTHLLGEKTEICANVMPGVEKATMFWMKNGFTLSPARSIFTNVNEQRLMAYSKSA